MIREPPSPVYIAVAMEVHLLNKRVLLPGQLWFWARLVVGKCLAVCFSSSHAQASFQSTLWLLLGRCWLFRGVSSSRDCGLDVDGLNAPMGMLSRHNDPLLVTHVEQSKWETRRVRLCGSESSVGRNAAACQEMCQQLPRHTATTVRRKVEARASWLFL